MKHGDKQKGSSAKAVSKASAEKSGKGSKASGESRSIKEVKTVAVASKGGKAKIEAAPVAEKGSGKAARKGGDNGAEKAHAPGEGGPSPETFTNPLVAAGYKRALKKYPNTFRKLSD